MVQCWQQMIFNACRFVCKKQWFHLWCKQKHNRASIWYQYVLWDANFWKQSKFWEMNNKRSDESEWGQQHFTLCRSQESKRSGKRNVRITVFRCMCRVDAYIYCSGGTEDLCTVSPTRRKSGSLLGYSYFANALRVVVSGTLYYS